MAELYFVKTTQIVQYSFSPARATMPDVLEELALSGVLFQEARPPSRPHSPASRTPSPNPDDELFGDLSREAERATLNTYEPAPEPVGMGPGRTGVKGVIRDRDEARARDRLRQREAMREMRRKMERTAITGKTYLEEEELKRGEEATRRKDEESEDDLTSTRPRKGHTIAFPGLMSDKERPTYGYLREVGANGFVQSVEQVDRDVWVVVHLYHPVCCSMSYFQGQLYWLMYLSCKRRLHDARN